MMLNTENQFGRKRIIGFFVAVLVTFLAGGTVAQMKNVEANKPEMILTEETQKCVACHEKEGIAVGVIRQWQQSKHAELGVGCGECHGAQEGEWDAFQCTGSEIVVGRHPTPKDCAECHDSEVEEFANSKHAHQFWVMKNADRSVFEFPIATRHGCEQCHNIGTVWPDNSVGECDACHAKHSYSKAVARQPETCGECHIGPDHPHIEIYNESKHGNIFKALGKKWDMNYSTYNNEEIPIEAPVCTTCHMDGNEKQPMTHDVSARLAWESQAPWSYRTVWDEENLGSWEKKRERMESICQSCHAPDFVGMYLLTADLVNLQYNEIRRFFVDWTKRMTEDGVIDRMQADGKFYSNPVLNGWDEEPEELMYYAWHHEGRRFRHGAEMMGADFTQWHGIWEIQEDVIELMKFAAEAGYVEALEWVNSNDPAKFIPFALYDVPGSAWGINTQANRTPFVYNQFPNYWEEVRKNVQAAYKNGLLSEKQWRLWEKRYQDKEYYLGTKFDTQQVFDFYSKRNDLDTRAFQEQVVKQKLPAGVFYKLKSGEFKGWNFERKKENPENH
ncbi:MAG: multiheme c-type cytochrome [bacterium]